jgi:hypothetical protein
MSSSGSDSSDSDDEMRSRILASCVTAEMIKETEKKVQKVAKELIKVGPYLDIEISEFQYRTLLKILDDYTEKFFEFREPKKKTNKRLEEQESLFNECPSHKLSKSLLI